MKLPTPPESLRRVAKLLEEFSAPSIAFSLHQGNGAVGASKLGGVPDLPRNFQIPAGSTAFDFLLQVNLSEASPLDQTPSLPKSGLLSFFYDLKEQPWGFDPKHLSGFHVHFTLRTYHLCRHRCRDLNSC
jgi:uncharacterized protein YwqG